MHVTQRGGWFRSCIFGPTQLDLTFLLIEQFHHPLPRPTMTTPSSSPAVQRNNKPRMESRKSSKSKNDGLLILAAAAADAAASGAAERLQSARIAAGSTASPHVDPPSGRAAGPRTEAPDLNDENVIRLGTNQPKRGGTKRFVEKLEEIMLKPTEGGFATRYRLIREYFSDATFWKQPIGEPWRHATDSEIKESVKNRWGHAKRKVEKEEKRKKEEEEEKKKKEEETLASASLTDDQIPMLSEVPAVEDRNSKSSNSRSEQVAGLSEHQEIEDKSDAEPSDMLPQSDPTVQDNQEDNGSDLEVHKSTPTTTRRVALAAVVECLLVWAAWVDKSGVVAGAVFLVSMTAVFAVVAEEVSLFVSGDLLGASGTPAEAETTIAMASRMITAVFFMTIAAVALKDAE
jgi:hypothetical protein